MKIRSGGPLSGVITVRKFKKIMINLHPLRPLLYISVGKAVKNRESPYYILDSSFLFIYKPIM